MTRKLALIADDEPDILAIVGMKLESDGYDVVEAFDGREAISIALKNPPDLLITDLAMPFEDGHELIIQFRASEGLRHIPIIAMSAIRNADVERITRWAGADYFIQKPFEIEDFTRVLEKINAS